MDAIIIGLGGMGRETAATLKRLIEEEGAKLNVRFVGIDVDSTKPIAATLDTEIQISLRNVSQQIPEFKKRGNEFLNWWIDNYHPNPPQNRIEGNTAANQVRIHGRLAFYNSYGDVRAGLSDELNRFGEGTPYVFIISSLGGGSGSGIFLDTAALIRQLKPDIQLYGLFLDGTITYKIVDRDTYGCNTLMNSYAALVELMHWMKYPHTYSMGPIKNIDNLFDACFIFQDRNKDDFTFVQSDISILKKNYFNLVAQTLYPIIGIVNFHGSVIANDWSSKFFGGLDGESKELAFTGAAVGRITFNKEKISEYILTYIIDDIFKEDPDRSISESFEKIEKDKAIAERDKRSFTTYIRTKSKAWENLQSNIVVTLERKLMDNASNDKALRDLPNNPPGNFLITRQDIVPESLRKLFEEYKKEVTSVIQGKFLELEEQITEKINEALGNNMVDKLIGWLSEAKGCIEKNIDHVKGLSNNYNLQQSKVAEAWSQIFKVKGTRFLGGVNPERLNKIRSYINLYQNYIEVYAFNEIEKELILKFFKDLKKFVESWLETLELFREKRNSILTESKARRGKITSRDIPLDKYRLRNREYPLEIKIDLNFDIIDKYIKDPVIDKLKKDNIIESFRKALWDGTGNQGQNFPGLKSYIKSYIFEKVREGKGAYVRGDESINDMINSVAFTKFKDEIKNYLQKFSIEDVLKWWLGEMLFSKVKVYVDNNRTEDLVKLAQEWEVIFGNESRQLTSPQNEIWRQPEEKVKERWIEDALAALIKKLDEYVKPFIVYNEAGNINRITELLKSGGNSIPALKTVFYPENFSEGLLKKLGWNPQKVDLPSSSLFIFSQEAQISPHSLQDYKYFEGFEIEKRYMEHVELVNRLINENKPLSVAPYHIDKRFYTQWKSVIGKVRPEEYTYWLIIFALGLGILKRDKYKGSKQQVFIYGSSKVADTLPKTVEVLDSNRKLRDSLKDACWKEIERLRVVNAEKFEVMEEAFKNAFDLLNALKGGRHAVWEAMYEMIEYDPAGMRTPNNRAPRTWEEVKALWERI